MERFGIYLVQLDPTLGAETATTRPYVIVSPNELNRALSTVIIAPMTTVRRDWPSRVPVQFQGKAGEIALDQLRGAIKADFRVVSVNLIIKPRQRFWRHW